jgi:putative spermidine/putrescine transport system ATP-binding protein
MRDGRVEQVDRPDIVYRQPRTPFVAGFIGQMNLVEGEVRGGRLAAGGMNVVAPIADGPAMLAVRPEFLELEESRSPDAPVAHRVIDYGTHLMVDIELKDGTRLKAMTAPAQGWKAGQRLGLKPREIALYRDGVVVHRGNVDATDTTPVAAHG